MLETVTVIDDSKLSGTYKVRSEYLWVLWNSEPFSAERQSGIRRTVDRDRETSKSAVTLGVSLMAFVVGLATVALTATPDSRPVTAGSSISVILVLFVLTYWAQRRVVMSSALLTRMDLSEASKNPQESSPLRLLEPLWRLFVR